MGQPFVSEKWNAGKLPPKLFLPTRIDQKLMVLPDQELMDIMAISCRKERHLCLNVLKLLTEAPEMSTKNRMIIISEYELTEKHLKGVFG